MLISNLSTSPQTVREVTNINVKGELVLCIVAYYPIPNTARTVIFLTAYIGGYVDKFPALPLEVFLDGRQVLQINLQ